MFDFVALRLQYLHEGSASCGLQNQSKWLAHVYTQPKTSSLGHGHWAAGVSMTVILPLFFPSCTGKAQKQPRCSHTCGVQ